MKTLAKISLGMLLALSLHARDQGPSVGVVIGNVPVFSGAFMDLYIGDFDRGYYRGGYRYAPPPPPPPPRRRYSEYHYVERYTEIAPPPPYRYERRYKKDHYKKHRRDRDRHWHRDWDDDDDDD